LLLARGNRRKMRRMRLPPTTVRMKLALTAAAGLVLMGLMAAMVLNTSSAAFGVVARTQADHERMRSFVQLRFALDRLQGRAYEVVRSGQAEADAAKANLDQARAEFRPALERAQARAPDTDYGRTLVATINRHSEDVEKTFAQGAELQQATDAVRADGGDNAAVEEMRRLSAPYLRFVRTVDSEIERSDSEVAAATGRAVKLQRSMRTAALLGLALGITVTAVIFVLLMWRLGPALQHLESGARAFGAGRLEHRVHVGGRDELAQLASAFNAMARELGEKQTALEESRAGLGRAVAERTAELKEANAALSAEDERRRLFLAEASHELRIPVTIIRGEAEVALRSGASGSAEAAETFERILEQTRDITRLLQDLFLIAHAEAGGLRLTLQSIDVNELVAHLAHDFSTLAFESGASVRADVTGTLFASIDAGRVRQALSALIDNALRHTREGVSITLGTQLEGDIVHIRVDDDGPGIPESEALDLFGRFRRGATRGEGSGLGLTVVRALAQAHGGTASLRTSAAGGVSAVVSLPRAPVAVMKAVA
jgi:two-component system OmpR family sensor kinase